MPILFRPPPSAPIIPRKGYGRYCIKAKSRVLNEGGDTHINITGYDTDLTISERVAKVAKHKGNVLDLEHTEVEVVFLTQTELIADGTIFMDYAECDITLIIPPWHFR
tara:strand:- start:729 stop:1052 length:324 start_codon:yes stop_codon:yes gene_type:complete